jgi:hypothetical protein
MKIRECLPNRRSAESFDFEVAGLKYTATIGRFPDGRPAEIFLNNHKHQSASDMWARDAGIICSIALQHSVPLETMRNAIGRDGIGHPTSPIGAALDLIARETPFFQTRR